MAKTKKSVVRAKRVRTTNKHLPTTKIERKAKPKKAEKPVSIEVGVIPASAYSAEPIEAPNPSWIHRMKVNFPNGVKHLMKVLNAHDLYTFGDACDDFHKNPEPFRMFFKSTGLETETENTLEVLQLKLVQGFKKVEAELIEHGMGEDIII